MFSDGLGAGSARTPLIRLAAGLIVCMALVAGGMDAGVRVAAAQDRTPLAMEDQTGQFQRVLTRPGAVLRVEPADTATVVDDLVPTFTVYYVFERREAGGREWVEVGGPIRGPALGWVRTDQVIDWDHTMVVAFSNPANRERVLGRVDGVGNADPPLA